MGDIRNACKMLITEPERMRQLSTLGCKWNDNIVMNLKGIGRCVLDLSVSG
jgi:hypothetical protein